MTSPSVQARMAEMMKDAQKAAEEAKKAAENDDDEAYENYIEKIHKSQIDSAMLRIVSARNMELDGKPVKTKAQIRKVLEGTPPEVGFVLNDDGTQKVQASKDKDGNEIMVPIAEITCKTFAGQVIERSEESLGFFGVTPSA